MKRILGIPIIMVAGLAFFLFGIAYSQVPDPSWIKYYGGSYPDQGWQVEELIEGGYVIVGNKRPSDNEYEQYIYLIKTDENGDTIWTRTYCDPEGGGAQSVKQTTDRGFIIAGYTAYGEPPWSVYLLKTDNNGDTLWSNIYAVGPYQSARSVDLCNDGGYIVAGFAFDSTGENQIYIIKTDSVGEELWSRTFGGSNNERSWSVIQISDGGYAVAGWTESTENGDSDVYVIKLNSEGDRLWSKTYGGAYDDEARAIVEIPGEGFALAGKTRSSDGHSGIYLMKISSSSEIIWERTYAQDNNVIGQSLDLTSDGGFIVGGYRSGYTQDYILRTNSDGDSLWAMSVITADSTLCRSIRQTIDGGYVLTGNVGSVIYLAKLEPEQTAIGDNNIAPGVFSINQNYPNPFNPSTTIRYSLPAQSDVRIEIYNILGQRLCTVFEGTRDAGERTVTWDASDFPSGIYFYRVQVGDYSKKKKMMLLK